MTKEEAKIRIGEYCGYGDGGEVKYEEKSYTCPYCGCCLEGIKKG